MQGPAKGEVTVENRDSVRKPDRTMCLICVDFQKGKLTASEAMRNYWEIVSTLDPAHAEELADQIQIAIFKEELEKQ